MDEKIRSHVAKYNAANAWETTDKSIVETIREGKHVWSGDESSRRWWTDCFTVVDVGGMLIGFDDAKTTGDESAEDRGWEFDQESICEVRSKEVTTTTTVYEKC